LNSNKKGDDFMQCRAHGDRVANNTCNQCASWLCDECTIDVQGRLFCRSCLASYVSTDPVTTPTKTTRSHVNWGLLFMFSLFPPGANYMFMGLMKRGLATMCGFFLLIFMITVLSGTSMLLVVFALIIYVLTSVFDGFNIRRRINAGESITDNLDDMLGGLFRNKLFTFVIFVLLALVFLGGLFSSVASFLSGSVINVIVWIAIILIIVKVVSKKRTPPRE